MDKNDNLINMTRLIEKLNNIEDQQVIKMQTEIKTIIGEIQNNFKRSFIIYYDYSKSTLLLTNYEGRTILRYDKKNNDYKYLDELINMFESSIIKELIMTNKFNGKITQE